MSVDRNVQLQNIVREQKAEDTVPMSLLGQDSEADGGQMRHKSGSSDALLLCKPDPSAQTAASVRGCCVHRHSMHLAWTCVR